jgi:hypothetical protein
MLIASAEHLLLLVFNRERVVLYDSCWRLIFRSSLTENKRLKPDKELGIKGGIKGSAEE